jgi:hypothetical protein
MNDFTKEELVELKCALRQDLNKFGDPYHQELLDKVNMMIYNFCDHSSNFYKFQYGQHNINYCYDCKSTFLKGMNND